MSVLFSYDFIRLSEVLLIARATYDAKAIVKTIIPIKIFLPLFLDIEVMAFFIMYIFFLLSLLIIFFIFEKIVKGIRNLKEKIAFYGNLEIYTVIDDYSGIF